MLAHGADANLNRRVEADTAVEVAAKLGSVSIVELLLDHAARLRDSSALHYAAMHSQSAVMELLLCRGQDVDAGARKDLADRRMMAASDIARENGK